jgi:tetratricopeptide (TPR) repeat protein
MSTVGAIVYIWRQSRSTVMCVAGLYLCSLVVNAQAVIPSWQQEVRRSTEQKDWTAAMAIVNRQIDLMPHNADVRGWRARVLLWSGKLVEAEMEYNELLATVPRDPDLWLGLGTVYLREGRGKEALQALTHAVELDPKRADLRVARAGALRTLGRQSEARLELKRAVDLDPTNENGRAALIALRGEGRHELRLGVNSDLFSFADANQDGAITVISHWSPHWASMASGSGYYKGGTGAEKFIASLIRDFGGWGTVTLGGAIGHDNGVIPKHEAYFEADRGFRLHRTPFVHGLEIVYGQHWYWYSTARILTFNEMTLLYLPGDWTWSLGLTGSQSHFYGAGSQWRPSGVTRLGFPIASREQRRLGGNVFYAVGTENFAHIDQIGEFASHTYGGGLRLQFAGNQDVTGFAAYQSRSQDHTESSFGFSYGIRF